MSEPQPTPIRFARLEERAALEELQWRASLVYDSDRPHLLANPDAIELPDEQIAQGCVRVAVDETGRIIGFAVLLAALDGCCELDGLFVEPERWRGGTGRALIADAVDRCRRARATAIEVTANPNALAFYDRVGFIASGSVATRFGPGVRMRLALD